MSSFFKKSAVVFLMSFTQTVFANPQPTLTKQLLLEHEVDVAGTTVNTKTIHITLPPLFKSPLHTHEGAGARYVVKGKVKVVEGDNVGTYSTGEVFWESGKLMSIENVTSEPAELIIFEVISN